MEPTSGLRHAHRNLRIGYFSQHHVDQLDLKLSSLEFLMRKFPNQGEQVYRSQLANFNITEMLALQPIGSLSGGQKSRVAFVAMCMSKLVSNLKTSVSMTFGWCYACRHNSPQTVHCMLTLGLTNDAVK
ncbi:unnamed protein product [Trichobilharzia regenti]|nr:unnamed protein product [Trichobilharzia regenti]